MRIFNKIFLIGFFLIGLVLLNGCSKKSPDQESSTTEPTRVETETQSLQTTIPVGLYLKNKAEGSYELIDEYQGPWEVGKDIKSFETFASDEPLISGASYGSLWQSRWDDKAKSENQKIGYLLTLEKFEGEEITVTITRPSDTIGSFNEYIEVWLYDDIYNLDASWYSHLNESDFYDTSLLTSIKLTAANKIDDLKEIRLKAFLYSNEDGSISENGNFIGNNFHEISINRSH